MVPFVSLSFYKGAATNALGGADVSWAVGLAISGGLYYLFSRSLDLGHEQVAVRESRAVLVGQPG
jgi:hypothetical protein